MAGRRNIFKGMSKRKPINYSQSRLSKCARPDGNNDDRRNFKTDKHPGSYASTHAEEMELSKPLKSTAPKRKYAVLLGYVGTDYAGLQMNPGVSTVEAELERAFYLTGGIDAENFGIIQKVSWSRSGRTDKGVHAIGQTIGVKLQIDNVEEYIAKVNAKLPESIRIFQCLRTTKVTIQFRNAHTTPLKHSILQNFNAKISCQKRTHEYIAPSFLFAPKETIGNFLEESDSDTDLDRKLQAYRICSETVSELNLVLAGYHGSNNFHNFTSKLEPTDPSSQRYILSFEASQPFEIGGMEWIQLKVVGQSFLLHHIRKMIALAVEIVRGQVSDSVMTTAMSRLKMDLPRAPSEGLYLARAHFDVYNEKVKDLHPPLEFNEPEVVARVQSMRQKIQTHIVNNEKSQNAFRDWIKILHGNSPDYKGINFEEWRQMKSQQTLDEALQK